MSWPQLLALHALQVISRPLGTNFANQFLQVTSKIPLQAQIFLLYVLKAPTPTGDTLPAKYALLASSAQPGETSVPNTDVQKVHIALMEFKPSAIQAITG